MHNWVCNKCFRLSGDEGGVPTSADDCCVYCNAPLPGVVVERLLLRREVALLEEVATAARATATATASAPAASGERAGGADAGQATQASAAIGAGMRTAPGRPSGFTIDEAMAQLTCGRTRVFELLSEGLLRRERRIGRRVMIDGSSLAEARRAPKSNHVPPAPRPPSGKGHLPPSSASGQGENFGTRIRDLKR